MLERVAQEAANLASLAPELTWLDWAILGTVAYFAMGGTRRGFLVGVLDLLSVVVAYGAAIVGYQPVADLLIQRLQLPGTLASLAAFLGLLVIGQIAYSLLVNSVLMLIRPLLRALRPLEGADRALGVVPGAAKGVIAAAVLLLPFTLLPVLPELSGAIERSAVASRLVAVAASEAPAIWGRLPFADRVVMPALERPPSSLIPGRATILPDDATARVPVIPEESLDPDPEAEAQMLELVNNERLKVGLRPLVADNALRNVSRAHSQEMFVLGYFSHYSPNTGSPFDRLRAAGIRYLAAGENLAYAPSVMVAHEGLMDSPGHRANILRPEFGRVGIGAIRGRQALRPGTMFTQVFRN